MTFRTTSLTRQHQVWALLALVGIGAYIAIVLGFDLGNPLRFFGTYQMRVLLPIVIVFRILAHECRWDGVTRKVTTVGAVNPIGATSSSQQNVEAAQSPTPSASISQPQSSASTISSASPTPTITTFIQPSIPIPQPAFHPLGETAEELWNRARVMVHSTIPDFVEDAEYLDLVFSAAELGYVPALAKLGDYAFRRDAFVEAYFWTKLARRYLELSNNADPQGLKEIDGMLRDIRREWTAADQPLEYENVYNNFPEERGEIGRAFLRLDSKIEVKQTREYLQVLADNGNPDAALFVNNT